MKRITFLALTFVCSAFILSCDKDKDDVQKDMAADEQKSFLENVAVEFTQKVPASDFAELKTFAEDISYIFEDYSWSTVGDTLARDYYRCMFHIDYEYVDSVTDPDYFYYGYEELTMMMLGLSEFTGHFTAQDSGWVYSESDDLQFDFKDANDKACVLKIAQEGDVTTFSVPDIEVEDIDWYEDYADYYHGMTFISIDIPEKIVVSLTQDGKDMVKATLTPDLSSLDEGYFDIGKTCLLMGSVFELGNGYKVSFQAEESPNKKISLNCNLSNTTGELIAFTASGDPSGIPSYVLENMSDLDMIGDTIQSSEDLNTKNMYISFAVLGKAQIIGRVADYKEMASLISDINESEEEEEYRAALDKFNSKLDLGLYYNGSTQKEAYLQFELKIQDVEEVERHGEIWETIPVMVFSDGARVSCEEFFDEKGFTKAIDAFDALEAQYDALFNGEEE